MPFKMMFGMGFPVQNVVKTVFLIIKAILNAIQYAVLKGICSSKFH